MMIIYHLIMLFGLLVFLSFSTFIILSLISCTFYNLLKNSFNTFIIGLLIGFIAVYVYMSSM